MDSTFTFKSFLKTNLFTKALLGLVLILGIGAFSNLEASHYRYGSMSWEDLGGNQVEITISQAWRRSFYGSPNVGSTVNTGTLYFGDGSSNSLSINVTSVNVADDWFYGEYKVIHTYPGSGSYTAYYNSCCRIGSLQNNANGNFRSETNIEVGSGNNSPVATIAPIVNLQTNLSAASFILAASDPDGDALSYRLATSAEVAGGAGFTNPSGLSINSTTGEVTFNTIGLSVGNLYNVALVVEDNNANSTKAIADFIIKIVNQSTPPTFDYSTTPLNGFNYQVSPGTPINFDVLANDLDLGSTVTLSAVGLPNGSSLNPNLPVTSTSNPLTGSSIATSFSWTPSSTQLGSYVISFTAQDNNGVQTSTSVTISVSLKPVFDVGPTPAEGVHLVYVPGDLIQYDVQASDPDPLDVVTINKVEGKNMMGNKIPLYAGATFSPLPTATGNPTAGTFEWQTQASDWGHRHVFYTAEDSYGDIAIHEVSTLLNTTPVFTSTPITTATIGQPYSYTVKVLDPDVAYGDQLTIYSYNTPSWLTYVDNGDGTATLSGTPTLADVGTHNVSLEAQDINHHQNVGGIPSQLFNITVDPCLLAINEIHTDATCLEDNGTISVSLSGVNGIANVSWTGPNGFTSSSLNLADLEQGTYVINVSDALNCSATTSIVIDEAVDVTPPVLDAFISVEIGLDTGATYVFKPNDLLISISDDCPYTLTYSPINTSCDFIGVPQNVTVTATDIYGNSSNATVEVKTIDVMAPIISFIDHPTVQLDANGEAMIFGSTIDNGSTDNCSNVNFALSQSQVDCDDMPSVVIDVTVEDANGNSPNDTWTEIIDLQNKVKTLSKNEVNDVFQVTVNVDDCLPPVAICKDITIELDEFGFASILPEDADDGSFDNCGTPWYFTLDDSTFNCTDIGTRTVNMHVYDAKANMACCPVEVTIQQGPDFEAELETRDAVCIGEANGYAEVVVTKGCAKSILWSTGATSTFVDDLAAGDYSVDVTDYNNNVLSFNFTIGEPDGLDATAVVTNVSCNGNEDGSINLNLNDDLKNCGDYKTFTQGGWSTTCAGNNPGCYRDANFADVFPNGLTIGCASGFEAVFTSSSAIEAFLPVSGSPDQLVLASTDATATNAGVLAGQLVALTLNVTFDLYDTDFATATGSFANTIIDMPSSPFNGMKVSEFLDLANEFVGGCASTYTATEFNDAATALNENFVDGVVNNGNVKGLPTILWSTGETTEIITDLAPGTYTVEVMDCNGCVYNASFDILDQAELEAEVTTKVECALEVVEKCEVSRFNTGGHAVWLPNLASGVTDKFWFENGSGTFEEFADGTAHLYGEVYNANDAGKRFDLSVWFNAKRNWTEWSALGRDYKDEANNAGTNYLDWAYYEMDASKQNTLTGLVDYAGEVLYLEHMPSNYKYAFQVGENANSKDAGYGMAGWFTYTGSWTGKGDFNFDGNNCATVTQCAGTATVNPMGGTAPYTYAWSTGGTEQTETGLCEGTHSVLVTDANGCYTTIDFDIVNEDFEAPVAVCKSITVELDANGEYVINAEMLDNGSTDNCGIESFETTPSVLDCDDLGTATVVLTVNDVNGNSATCSTTITVEDNIDPWFVSCQCDIIKFSEPGQCGAFVQMRCPVIADDNCSVVSIVNDYNGTADATDNYPVGLTEVTWTVTDQSGNTASYLQYVYVMDVEDPTVACSPDQVVYTDAGACEAFVNVPPPTATDNCGIRYIWNTQTGFSHADGVYPVGTTTIEWWIEDVNGNLVKCYTDITVEDNEAPVVVCPTNVSVSTDLGICGANVNIPAPTATDNCGIATITNDYNNSSSISANLSVGSTTVVWTIEDIHGNATTCSQTIVVEDTEAPTASCKDITVQLDASGVVSISASDVDNGSTDNCGIDNMTITPSNFDCSMVGANTVTLTVTDIYGNTSTCTSLVTVEDVTAPTALCQSITVQLDASGNVLISAADIDNGSSDVCGIDNITVTPASFDCSDLGSNTVTLRVEDVNGNVSTCTAIVTVEDNINPTITNVPANITITASPIDCTPPVTWITPNADDNCSVTLTSTHNSGDDFPIGTTTVVYTAEDGAGNKATASFNVTVVSTILTASVSQSNVSCNGAADGSASVTVAGGCLPYTYSWSNGKSTSSISNLGGGTYTVTITDANGTSITKTFVISEPTLLAAIINGNDPTCATGTDGSAIVSVNGGTSPYTFLWSNNETNASIANLSSGTYSVLVTDANGCTVSAQISIARPACCNVTSAGAIGNGQENCGPFDPAAITSVSLPSGGLGGVEYLWLESNVNKPNYVGNSYWKPIANSNSASYDPGFISQTTYYIRCSRSVGCSFYAGETNIIAMVVNPVPSALSSVISNNECFGGSIGAAEVLASNGTAPYTYLWSNNETTSSISNLSAGTYNVVVEDANGCTANASVTITEPSEIKLAVNITEVSCQPLADCSNGVKAVKVKFTGSDGSTVVAKDENGNTIGNYTASYGDVLTVSSATTLGSKVNLCIVDDCDEVTVKGTNTKKKCRPETEATFYCNNSVKTKSSKDLSNVVLRLRDNNGNLYDYKFDNLNVGKSETFSYNNDEIVGVWIKSGCNSSGDGPGYGEWIAKPSSSSSSEECHELLLNCNNGIIGTTAGKFEIVEYTDGAGTSTNTNNPQPVCDGAIDLTITGGNAPYTVSWVDGSDKEDRDELCTGEYTVNVTDANGCGQTLTVSVQQDQCCNVTSAGLIAQDQSNCGSFDPATITSATNANGGAGSLEYKWFASTSSSTYTDGSSDWSEVSGATASSYDPSTISSTTYVVRVAKRTGCTVWLASNVITLEVNPAPSVVVNQLVAPNCNGTMATLQGGVSGSVTSYYWELDGAVYPHPSLDISNATPGTYTLYAVSGSCTVSASFTVVAASAPVVTANVTDASATKNNNASCDCEGKMESFTFKYEGNSTVDVKVYDKKKNLERTINNVKPGDYVTVNGYNSDGRHDSKTYLRVGSGSYVEIHTSCSIDILNETYGDYYIYSYTDGDGNYCNGGANLDCNPDISSLAHGEVISANQFGAAGITITAISNGNFRDELIIFDTDESNTSDPDLEVDLGNILIFPENNTDNNNDGIYDDPDDQVVGGKISLLFNNSRIVKSFKFFDSENNKGRVYCYDASNNLLSTTTIANTGDKSVQTVQVNTSDVKKMVIEYTTSGGVADFKFDCPKVGTCDGEIDLTVSGGTAPYSYTWSNTETTEDINGLCPGTYTVTVTDANGCTTVKTFDVDRSQDVSRATTGNKVHEISANEFANDVAITNMASLSAYPNPANANTTVNYILNESSMARVVLTDLSGKELLSVYDGFVEGGVSQQIQVDLSNVRSGVYLMVITSSANERLLERIVIAR